MPNEYHPILSHKKPSPSTSDLFTNLPLILGLLSASFFLQSYLILFLQMRILRFEWNLAIRARRSSGRYMPMRPSLFRSSIGHATWDEEDDDPSTPSYASSTPSSRGRNEEADDDI